MARKGLSEDVTFVQTWKMRRRRAQEQGGHTAGCRTADVKTPQEGRATESSKGGQGVTGKGRRCAGGTER